MNKFIPLTHNASGRVLLINAAEICIVEAGRPGRTHITLTSGISMEVRIETTELSIQLETIDECAKPNSGQDISEPRPCEGTGIPAPGLPSPLPEVESRGEEADAEPSVEDSEDPGRGVREGDSSSEDAVQQPDNPPALPSSRRRTVKRRRRRELDQDGEIPSGDKSED